MASPSHTYISIQPPVLIGPITKPAYNVEAVKRHTGGPIEACIRCLLGVDFSFSFTLFSSTEPSKHCLTFKLFDSQKCYALSWSRHQNVATLVQLGCKRNAWSSRFHKIIVMIYCFFNNIMQDMR